VSSIESNAGQIAARLRRLYAGQRLIAAIAGPPGSGKSTLAEAVVAALNAGGTQQAALLPMDGFHYDDAVLRDLGRYGRKGAIDTFDATGFVHLVTRLRANEEDAVAVPVFDRSIEIARAGARLIPRAVGIVVAEGNYLLVRRPPWTALKPLFDFTVLVDTPAEVLRSRLTQRWIDHGLDQAGIERKLHEVDLPNAMFVLEESGEPDLRIGN
jgi:pantothenate kinase